MVRWLGMLVIGVVVGCGGGTDTDGPSVTDGTLTEELGNICDDGIPMFEPEGCDQVGSAFKSTYEADGATNCLTDADCRALAGKCETTIDNGKCWVAANTCLEQSDLDAIAALWPCQSCNGDCRGQCGATGCPPRPEATCDRPDQSEFGKCVLVATE